MADDILSRVKRISAEVLPGKGIETVARGEDYYSFNLGNEGEIRSTLPPVWIDPHASDKHIRDVLQLTFRRALDPDSEPDDLTVPNLQTEGR